MVDSVAPIEQSVVEQALDALRERGPDGRQHWLSPAGDVALGHARLAVVDVAGGAQPLWNERGTVCAMLNGELYGAERLRAELRARGHVLRTRCDAELLVHFYEDEGAGLTRHLRGEYAFVLYDSERRRLLGARDPDGVRPLLLASHGSRVMLASTARALFAAGLSARWDVQALQQSAALQYPPPGRTLFAGVTPVPAGGLVMVDHAGVRVQRAETWPGAMGAADTSEHREPLAGLRAALEDAVRVRIPEEVSYACALSGGLDSSAVLALVTRITGHAPPAFTVCFEGDVQSEWDAAAETARCFGAEHHAVSLDDEALAALLPAAVRAGEGSAINAHLVGKWALAQAVARAGQKVLLSGEGADEVAFGYAHFLVDAGFAPTAEQQASLAGAMLAPSATGAECAPAATAVPHFITAKLALGARLHALGDFGDMGVNAKAAVDAVERATGGVDSRLHGLERSLAWWRALAFERYILGTLGDAVELAHGVEGRPPFLDREVQQAARRIAPLDFMRGGVEKQALRDALRGLVPGAVLERRKQPFLAAPMLLASQPGRLFELCHATLAGPSAPAFVNRAAVAAQLDRARGASLAERRDWEAPLMWMLTTALLEQELLR
ncbi:MAG: asparagine synthase (glutamine-hydrolyzing) [Sandaracinaceae bacterium]|nr:asparagine synthase (glutamine-hydrolyzing) [Sandaracinaceae bacterium]